MAKAWIEPILVVFFLSIFRAHAGPISTPLYYTTSEPTGFFGLNAEGTCQYTLRLTFGMEGFFELARPITNAGPRAYFACLGHTSQDALSRHFGTVYAIPEDDAMRSLAIRLPPSPIDTNAELDKACKKKFLYNLAVCNTAIALFTGWEPGANVRSSMFEGSKRCFEAEKLILEGCLKGEH